LRKTFQNVDASHIHVFVILAELRALRIEVKNVSQIKTDKCRK